MPFFPPPLSPSFKVVIRCDSLSNLTEVFQTIRTSKLSRRHFGGDITESIMSTQIRERFSWQKMLLDSYDDMMAVNKQHTFSNAKNTIPLSKRLHVKIKRGELLVQAREC